MQKQVPFREAIIRKYPEPVAVALAKTPSGVVNPITLGWVMPSSHTPPQFAISVGLTRYSLEVIREAGEFVLSFPSVEQAEEALFFGTESGRSFDKLAARNVPTQPTAVIDSLLLSEAVANFECVLVGELLSGDHVIFVGEMRDRETIEIALTAAETGNVVISTLASQTAAKTINRVIDVFPLEDQPEVRTRLALTLRCVISQVLLPRRDGTGRVAGREILLVNGGISNLIRENKIHQINNSIAGGSREGMCLLDDSLIGLLSEGIVNASEVIPRLQDPMKAESILRV